MASGWNEEPDTGDGGHNNRDKQAKTDNPTRSSRTSSNRVEALEETVRGLEATIGGLMDELVDVKAQLGVLEETVHGTRSRDKDGTGPPSELSETEHAIAYTSSGKHDTDDTPGKLGSETDPGPEIRRDTGGEDGTTDGEMTLRESVTRGSRDGEGDGISATAPRPAVTEADFGEHSGKRWVRPGRESSGERPDKTGEPPAQEASRGETHSRDDPTDARGQPDDDDEIIVAESDGDGSP